MPESWPASSAQQRLWLLDRISPGQSVYNMPGAVMLEGPLDRRAFRAAFADTVARHEQLRTAFELIGGDLHQVLRENAPALVEIDLSREAEALARAAAVVRDDAARAFDLEAGPLVRAYLLVVDAQRAVFSCNVHHIVSDEWSQDIMLAEVMQRYAGNEPASAALRYRDFAARQAAELDAPFAAQARAYWKAQLADVEPLRLPLDSPRPAEVTFAGANHTVDADAELTAALAALQRGSRVSPFQFLTAATKVLLARYCGQDDVTIGAPVSGRDSADVAGVVGNFVNTLVLRDRISGEQSFRSVLAQVKATTEDAYAHGSYPFDRILADVAPEPDLARAPLFDVAVIFQDRPAQMLYAGGLAVAPFQLGQESAKFDLSWYFSIAGDRLRITLNYNTALFRARTAAALTSHFIELLRAAVAAPDVPVAELEIVPATERSMLLDARNATAASYPATGIVELFEDVAERFADRVAIVTQDGEWTYAALNARANAIASALRAEWHVTGGDLVAVLLAPGFEAIATLLGVLKAGAAYVPLDPIYPAERLAFMIADAKPRLLVSDLSVPGFQPGVPLAAPAGLQGSTQNPPACSAPGDLAYVIYTSGSTGRPKGCCIEHRNVVRLLRNDRFPFAFSETDTWIVAHSLCFDFSVWEMYGALLYGGKLVVPDRESVRDTAAFRQLLRAHRVTVLNQTPAAFANLIACERGSQEHDLDGHVRYVIFGGDRLDPAQLRPWTHLYPLSRIALVNMFGITETTVHVTYGPLTAEDISAERGASPVGVPLPETTAYVFNAARKLQPDGVAGELYVGGSGVCRGYLDRPELTGERFVENPYRAGERLYKSGDLARRLPDGRLEHLGRNDGQVQIRGYRVELREIEARLREYPAIDRGVVIVRDGEDGPELIAYMCASSAPDPERLREHLRARLPDYMLPAHYVLLDELPLTGNNKLDVARLPAPERSRLAPAASVAPRDALERDLQSIWQRVLGVSVASVDESYFAAGGDSIKVIRLLSAVTQELGARLAVKDVFRMPTIAGMAETIRRAGDGGGEEGARGYALLDEKTSRALEDPDIRALDAEDVFPLTDIQAGMIFHGMAGEATGTYHEQFVFDLFDETYQPGVLRESLRLLAGVHAILRTSFHLASEPVQIVAREPAMDFASVDGRGWNEAALDAYTAELLTDDRRRPFDTSRPGLWRMRAVHAAADRVRLVWTFHHAILDGWSNASLLAELIELYERRKADAAVRPRALRAGYRDVVAEQLQIAESAETAAFWRTALEGAERTPLPFGVVAEPGMAGERERTVTQVDPQVAGGLAALARAAGVPIRDVYVAAFHAWLEFVTGSHDVLFGLVGHMRPAIADGDRIAGCCLNSVPFRARLAAALTPAERVRDVHARLNEMRAHDKLSTRRIGALGETGTAGENRLFDVLFNFVDFHVLERLDAGFLNKSRAVKTYENTNTPLDVSVSGTLGSHSVTMYARAGLFDAADAERLARYFTRMLAAFANAPDEPIAREALLGDEIPLLLKQSMGPRTDYPRDAGIASLFEEHVRLHPSAVAIEAVDGTLTYAELDARATALARTLTATYAVRPEEIVAIRLPRSVMTAVAMVAVLKAGGAYLPIDPAFPQARVEIMLADAKCRYLIADNEVPAMSIDGVRAVDVGERSAGASQNSPAVADGRTLAYAIYTSGSTGRPKGSLVEQRSVVRLVRDTNYVAIRPGDRVAQAGSIAFDASTFEIWGALLNGARVVMLEASVLLDLHRLRDALRDRGVTVLFLTTALFNQCVEMDGAMFAPLRVLLTGGENASPAHFERVRRALPQLELLHVYGPTENTTFSTFLPVTREFGGTVPIGRPLANSTAYILDRELRLVPHGVPGEICTGGDGVARGYISDAEPMRAVFTADPFAPGGRLYRTGDLARLRDDGTIEFVGRIDNQVKVRGFRIEPGDVETAVRSHPDVLDAIVVPLRNSVGTTELAAYYTARTKLAPAAMRAFLSERQPAHMVPAHCIALDAMPLSFTGKIDRTKLPPPGAPVEREARGGTARTPEERLLCELWPALLGRASVGLDDDYFELGGDSIKAIQLSSRLQRAGWKLDVRDLFTSPTIAQLAPKLRRANVTREAREVAGPVPLSPIQRWFFAMHRPASNRFNMSLQLRASERLDEEHLRAALESVWLRHDVLRATFHDRGGAIEQVPGAGTAVAFDVRDESGAARLHGELDVAAGPLFRAALVRGSDADRVMLVFHHLIVDGVSLRIIVEDLERAYRGLPPLAKTDAFGVFTQALEVRPAAAPFSGAPDVLRPERPGGSNRYGDCRSIDFAFSTAETERIVTGLPAQADVQSVLLTALVRALIPVTPGASVSLALEGHGREPFDDRIDVSRTVGWFTALTPVTLELAGGTFADQARAIRAQVIASAASSDPFGNHMPSVAFNYLGAFDGGAGDTLFAVEGEVAGTPIDPVLVRSTVMDVTGAVLGGCLRISLVYSHHQFERATIAAIGDRMRAELLSATAAPSVERPRRFAGVSADDLARAMGDLD